MGTSTARAAAVLTDVAGGCGGHPIGRHRSTGYQMHGQVGFSAFGPEAVLDRLGFVAASGPAGEDRPAEAEPDGAPQLVERVVEPSGRYQRVRDQPAVRATNPLGRQVVVGPHAGQLQLRVD